MATLVHEAQRMKRTLVSNAALLAQLLAASAGLTLAGQADQPPQTASEAKLNKSDRDLTQQIRKAIVSDKSLSSQAHNIKILTKDGAVMLKGQVKTDEEKKAIEDKAGSVAGSGKVTSELTVGPNTSKKSE
jgi:osmotically-inducible protein OsmY